MRRPSKLRRAAEAKKEDLVPLRLEIDVEHHKLRETFVWNVNGEHLCWSLHFGLTPMLRPSDHTGNLCTEPRGRFQARLAPREHDRKGSA